LGKAVPRDLIVLGKLFSAARDRDLPEAKLFHEARQENDPTISWEQYYRAPPQPDASRVLEVSKSLPHWRYVAAVRLAMTYYPEIQPALEKALAPALRVVDTLLSALPDPQSLDDYYGLDRNLIDLAEDFKLQELQERWKEKERDKEP
jgi:hypothetical protein